MTNAFNPEPLTRDNAAMVFVDNQVGLMTGVRDHSIAELKANIVGMAKAAKAFRFKLGSRGIPLRHQMWFILFGRMDHVSTFTFGTQDAVSEIY